MNTNMNTEFKEVDYHEMMINPMTLISEGWLLITAGTKERGFNTMTASWGHLGAIWGQREGKPTAIVYIRPQRYTKEFVDREESFTLSFFPEECKKALGYLGSHSGRDEDKISKVGLTPVFGDNSVWFEEATLVMNCRKLYHAPLLEDGFVDKELVEQNYPRRDFHEMYVGEIMKVLMK